MRFVNELEWKECGPAFPEELMNVLATSRQVIDRTSGNYLTNVMYKFDQ